ncbi:MAG TPA: nuclear transport factor 2 family protein [Xanthobacteraceae bacterium]|nr:nuclear transport factor 2 family protein [Xanthobacteraceae bacterium]
MNQAQQLVERYVAVWHETDPAKRREAIAALWVPDGVHYVGTREVRGYDALEQRVIGSHEKNVRDGGNRFRSTTVRALRDAVTFEWEMFPAPGGDAVGAGFEFLIVDEDFRIRADYQFIVK